MQESAARYSDLLIELAAGKKAVMVTVLEPQTTLSPRKILLTEETLQPESSGNVLDEELCKMARQSLQTSKLLLYEDGCGSKFLIEPHLPEPRLIILGGGHIAQPLAEFGAKTGFSVTVVDDRPVFANAERFPLADRVICESFSRCFDTLNLNGSAFVAVVTRGHRHDLDCLRQILPCQTAYVGMIGSRRRVKAAWEQLLSEGYTQEQLDRVNAPIGLAIGAISPTEIAVSIIAQVIGVRRLGPLETHATLGNQLEFDLAVLKQLSAESHERKALVTVMATKGSSPRKAGAKMLVWSDGRTVGSIGGGCSESEITLIARDVIGDGQYQVRRVDMTADAAADEGMVCGGIMDVIIEPY